MKRAGEMMTNDTWGRVRDNLRQSVGHNNFVTWIAPLEFEGVEDGVALFHVPTSFLGDWVSRNYADQIRQQITLAGGAVSRVEFRVAPRRPAPPAQPVAVPSAAATVAPRA